MAYIMVPNAKRITVKIAMTARSANNTLPTIGTEKEATIS
jgi:hypothetical protein